MPQEQSQAPQDLNQPTVQDDQLAAALGFLTTISELHMGMGQPQEGETTDMQSNDAQSASEIPPEASKQPPEGGGDEKARDDAMEKEIADIRAELEALKQDDTTGTTTENTEPTS